MAATIDRRLPKAILGALALAVAFASGYVARGGGGAPSSQPAASVSATPMDSEVTIASSTAELAPAVSALPAPSTDAIDRARLKALEHQPARARSIAES